MNYDFVLNSRYDKTAYQALAEASWQLFRKPKMQTQAYPILIALVVLVAITLVFNRGSYGPPVLAAAVAFCLFVLAAIPLSAVSAKGKMCRNAVKDAAARGEFPADIRFAFGKDAIHATVNGNTAVVQYGQASAFAVLGEWRFLFFGQAAYIFHGSSFQGAGEPARFEAYIREKCGLSPVALKGSGPQR